MRLNLLIKIPKLSSNKDGSITVFLSMAGILVLALLGTMVETARFSLCENQGERGLFCATESLLAEYSRPLEKQYGLFGVESGGEAYETSIARYLSYGLEPGGDHIISFLTQQNEEIKIEKKEYMGDDKASILQEQIEGKMLRKAAKEGLKKFLSKADQITETETKAAEIEKQVEQEKKEADNSRELVKLMRLIDGIYIQNGKVCCEKYFMKMFGTGAIKSQKFGVSEKIVWEKMKKKIHAFSDYEKKRTELKKDIEQVIRRLEEAVVIRDRLQKTGILKESESAFHQMVSSLVVLDSNLKVLKDMRGLLMEEETDWEDIKACWKGYQTETPVFDYTGVQEQGGGENPISGISEAWKKGILNLVWEKQISKKEISSPDNYNGLYKEDRQDEKYQDRVTDFLDEEKVDLKSGVMSAGKYALGTYALDQYIQQYFTGFMSKGTKWKRCLDYQWEYILCGKKSDAENLNSVLNRILLIRMVNNFFVICRDSRMEGEARAAALAIVGFTGMQPLVTFTKTMILLAWSMVESLVDISALLQQRHVPVVKTSEDILTTFPQIFQIRAKDICARARKRRKADIKSFKYETYVQIFWMMMKPETRRYRVMDLIDGDMAKNGHPGFSIGTMTGGLTVSGKFQIPARFFRMPSASDMLKRQLTFHSYETTVTVRYV